MIIRLLIFSIIMLFCGQGGAQSIDEELRFYDVELIIFKNLRGPKGEELILPVSSPTKDKEIFDIASAESVLQTARDSYQLLSPEQLQLHDRVEKIVKSPYFELLIHAGWRQPGLSLKKSIPIWIRGGKTFSNEYVSIDNHLTSLVNTENDEEATNSINLQTLTSSENSNSDIYELEGKITISLSRYLHTYTDLVLRKPRLTLDDVLENPDSQSFTNGQITEAHILDNHNLKEHRRMRSKRLHYLDNPEFAMLILITPYELEQSESVEVQ